MVTSESGKVELIVVIAALGRRYSRCWVQAESGGFGFKGGELCFEGGCEAGFFGVFGGGGGGGRCVAVCCCW